MINLIIRYYKNYNGLLEWTIDNIEEGVPYFQESNGKYLSWEDYKSKIHEYGWTSFTTDDEKIC